MRLRHETVDIEVSSCFGELDFSSFKRFFDVDLATESRCWTQSVSHV